MDEASARGQHQRRSTLDMKLEVVVVPVTDVDRAKCFSDDASNDAARHIDDMRQ